jgi:hypothetical protein
MAENIAPRMTIPAVSQAQAQAQQQHQQQQAYISQYYANLHAAALSPYSTPYSTPSTTSTVSTFSSASPDAQILFDRYRESGMINRLGPMLLSLVCPVYQDLPSRSNPLFAIRLCVDERFRSN